ncbi:MAG: DUF2066 domain-containing protein [Alphaproteobacteria bacterium]
MWIRCTSVTLLLGIFLAAGGAALSVRSAGANSHVFTVSGVPVDVTAETAAAARETAHAEGHVKALDKLLARLLPRDELSLIRQLEPAEILAYVQDFSVANERTSDVRYLADLTFRFRPEPIRELLRTNGLQHAETMSKPVVVLAIFGVEGEAVLWGQGNPWLAAWAARPPGGWLVPLIVPLGDLGDLTAIDAVRALNGETEALGAIARHYGAEDVLITQSVLLDDPLLGQATLQVGTVRLGRYAQQTTINNYAQPVGGTAQDLLAFAADAVAAAVQEAWKQRNLLRPGSQRQIAVTVPVTQLAELLEVKRRLVGVAAVRGTTVTALSRSKVELAIAFVGEEEQLVLAMAQSDLGLTLYPGIGWELRLGGAAPARPIPVAVPALEPAALVPTTDAPPTDVPTTGAPTTDAPTTDAPTTDAMPVPSFPAAE